MSVYMHNIPSTLRCIHNYELFKVGLQCNLQPFLWTSCLRITFSYKKRVTMALLMVSETILLNKMFLQKTLFQISESIIQWTLLVGSYLWIPWLFYNIRTSLQHRDCMFYVKVRINTILKLSRDGSRETIAWEHALRQTFWTTCPQVYGSIMNKS